jgi:hypothetical protein
LTVVAAGVTEDRDEPAGRIKTVLNNAAFIVRPHGPTLIG